MISGGFLEIQVLGGSKGFSQDTAAHMRKRAGKGYSISRNINIKLTVLELPMSNIKEKEIVV